MFFPLISRNAFALACRHYSNMNKRQLTTAACCIIGDEILNGKTRDSNAYFLGTYSKILAICFC